MNERGAPRRKRRVALLGPGLLVAATGVGAGDLATGAFTGAKLGVAVLWAAFAGAALKFVLNEGLMRWQLATGQTVLEGALLRLGRPARWLFLLYLIPWSWFVGSALISAAGAATHALIPVFARAEDGKVVFGIAMSLLGLWLVRRGGYRLFEIVMRVCIGLMFATVLATAALLAHDWGAILRGLAIPSIPHAEGQGLGWTLALMGGIGGTLTVLCYGYWIRAEGRDHPDDLGRCRVDLAVAYAIVALFGVAMVTIGSTVAVEERGAGLIVALGAQLEQQLGSAARWTFLAGAWATVFSSLLGVWQSVPYVFADFCAIVRRTDPSAGTGATLAVVDPSSRPYRSYLWALALVPMGGLWYGFREVQQAYALVGAAFLPLLALALLVLNGRAAWVGARFRNRPPTVLALLAALLFFAVAGVLEALGRLG